MINDLTGILSKLLVVIIIIIIFYIINKYLYNNSLGNSLGISLSENFENNDTVNKKEITYTKLKETYVEPNPKTLDILYANYSGEEVGKPVWEGKTLDQCTDTCNKIDKCIGFSRDAIMDSEPGKCIPHSQISTCHSNRKGNPTQMNNAIKFNTYFKANVENMKNLCVGDSEFTLNRLIFLKSYTMPNTYIGNLGGDSLVVLVDKSANNFKESCNFRIEVGKDGIGTVSFLHINTNKYLYRDETGKLIVKDISSGATIDKQRASFNIHDGISQSIMLHPMTFDGETTAKFVMIDGNYLKVDRLIPNDEKMRHSAMFYIVDTIVESKIISGNNGINMSSSNSPSTSSSTQLKEGFEVNLDNSKDIPVYYNLFNTPPYIKIDDYVNDYYNKNMISLDTLNFDKKFSDILIEREISKSITKNEDEYNALNELNGEIEKKIYDMNYKMNNKNDYIINRLDKMKLTDLANDYFFLKFMNK